VPTRIGTSERIGDQSIMELGPVPQRERSAKATLSDGSGNRLEIEDALRMSRRQTLLPCLWPTIRKVGAADAVVVAGSVGQNICLELVQVRGVIACRVMWPALTERSDALDAERMPPAGQGFPAQDNASLCQEWINRTRDPVLHVGQTGIRGVGHDEGQFNS
jgi:hypothetical protein